MRLIKKSDGCLLIFLVLFGLIDVSANDIPQPKKGCVLQEKPNNKTSLKEADRLMSQGATEFQQGKYPDALKNLQESAKIRKNLLDKQDPGAAMSYNFIGLTHGAMGQLRQSLDCHQKALSIREKVLGSQHIDTGMSYNNIGLTYGHLGKYSEALEYHQKALAIAKKEFGSQHPVIATSYNNIGAAYQYMGNYSIALEYLEKALAIQKSKQDAALALTYNNLGENYRAEGDLPTALKYHEKSLAIRERALGKQHPDTAMSYHNIGGIFDNMGNPSMALEYLEKSLAIMGKAFIDQHPSTAMIYNNIGFQYGAKGDHPKKQEYLFKALNIREKILGKQHPDTAATYHNIGTTYGDMGKHSEAYRYSKKSFTGFLEQRDNNFSALDSQQKNQYLKTNEPYIDFLLIHSSNYQKELLTKKEIKQVTELNQTTLNDWLAYKGSVLESENRLIRLAKTSKDSAIQKKYQRLVQLKQSYSTLNQTYPQSGNTDAWKQQLSQQKEHIARLEREITQSDPRFKNEQVLKKVNSKELAKGLQNNELYIDYGKTNGGYYLFTIDHNNHISFSSLGKESSRSIDEQVAVFGEDIQSIIKDKNTQPDQLDKKSQAALSALYELLINKPLADKLVSKTSLIISPDGALRLLPFEALYNKANKQYLIQQKDIRYIASGKELVRIFRQQEQSSNSDGAKQTILFANPDFGIDPKAEPQNAPIIVTRNTNRAISIRSLNKVAPLPGTQKEAEGIIRTLEKTKRTNYKFYNKGNASEENLLKTYRPNILHIATHGFFDAKSPNPMLQSGIILAGANYSLDHDQGEGIVTALDLSGLDLKGTELIVLSACETGVVDPNSTDGISGLTKAFIQAGASDVIMSLWSVADTETANLMQAFYREHKTEGKQYAAALKQSKLAMIKQGLHPYYWAGFVLNGL